MAQPGEPFVHWRFEGGTLLCGRPTTDLSDERPNLAIATSSGSREIRFWVPDAQRVRVSDFTVAQSGYVVSGSAVSSAGSTGFFIALLDSSGNVKKIVRTAPFEPHSVAACPSGEIWALGSVAETSGGVWPEHNTVQRFDKDGNNLGSTLPFSSFPKTPFHPGLSGTRDWSHIRCSGGGAAVVSAAAKQIVMLDSSGKETERLPLAKPDPGPIPPDLTTRLSESILTDFAVTPSGVLYAGYVLAHGQGFWTPIEIPQEVVNLVGVNGERPVKFYDKKGLLTELVPNQAINASLTAAR